MIVFTSIFFFVFKLLPLLAVTLLLQVLITVKLDLISGIIKSFETHKIALDL